MLGIGKIAGGGDTYYLEAVAGGADEYYRGVGEAPGEWAGAAAIEFGLSGEVDPDDLRAVWNGLDPQTGSRLGNFPNRTVHVFDLTFKAPKSVSILFGLGGPEIAREVRDAHDAAVRAAVGYLEREAVRSRAGKGGAQVMEVSGLMAAQFRHRTSRAGDPHLHTHVLAANLAHGVDGKWRTLDGRALFGHALTAGYLYQAHLRDELTTRLGVDWNRVERGCADVAGIDRSVIDGFSERRRQIQEHLDQVGFHSARAAEIATLETRAAKDPRSHPATMRGVWHAKADDLGLDPSSIGGTLDPARAPHADPTTDRSPLPPPCRPEWPDQAGFDLRPTRRAPGDLGAAAHRCADRKNRAAGRWLPRLAPGRRARQPGRPRRPQLDPTP